MKYILLISIAGLALMICCSNSVMNSNNQGDVLIIEDARKAALYYSEELRPPLDMTRRISRELQLIRDTWQDSIPEVHDGFVLPWNAGFLSMIVDQPVFDDIISGRNMRWNRLCKRFDLEYYRYLPSLFPNWIAVRSKNLLNPLRLGEYFVGFPGIEHIQSVDKPAPYPQRFLRLETDNEVKYWFEGNCNTEELYNYYYFMVSTDSAILNDSHRFCHEKEDSLFNALPIDSFTAFYQHYYDSVWINRPPWIDTVLELTRDFYDSEQFQWSRDK